jgi:hypothetical protein
MKIRQLLVLPLLIVFGANTQAQVPDMVLAPDAIKYVGEYAMVCGVIATADYMQNVRGAPTHLNFGKPYPNQDFSVVIWGKERKNFDVVLQDLDGHKACAYGKIETYRGKAQIMISQPEQLNYKAPEPQAVE